MCNILRLLQDKEDFLRVHGPSPFTGIKCFTPWRNQAAIHALVVLYSSKRKTLGIYGDILHIFDLQITPDIIASVLLELSDGFNRDASLKDLYIKYNKWCGEQGP